MNIEASGQRFRDVLTVGEIRDALSAFIVGEWKATRELADECGPYLLEAEVNDSEAGGMVQYAFRRAGTYREFQTRVTTIEVVYYKNGIPVGGKTVANFVNGKWNRYE